MDEMDVIFWRLVSDVLVSIELELNLVQDLLTDVENWDDNMELIPRENALEDLENLLAPFLEQQLIEMDLEEDLVFRLIYGRNDRNIDWHAQLPKMDYLRGLEDPTFLQQFRMDKPTFESLIVFVGNHLTEQGRLRTEIDKCMLMALWILANLDTFRATGVQFGGTVHFHYLIIIEALRELAPKFIKWPSMLERQRMKESIEARTGFPGIVGMIDGTLIKVTAPLVLKERYYDRHQNYSINVQAVCDEDGLFRDLYVGEPGSVHDIRVFQRSQLHDMFLERNDLISENEHIIGDGGYECRRKLLIPFRDLGLMTRRERLFNYILSSIRMSVERAGMCTLCFRIIA